MFKPRALIALIMLTSSLPAQLAAQDGAKPAPAKQAPKALTKASPAPRLFTSKNGYSVVPPKGWEIVSIQSLNEPQLPISDELLSRFDPTTFDVMFIDDRPQRLGSESMSDVFQIKMWKPFVITEESAQAAKRSMVDTVSKSVESYKLIKFETVRVNKTEMLKIEQSFVYDGERFYIRQFVLPGAQRSVIITCTMDPSRIKARAAECDAVAASIKLR